MTTFATPYSSYPINLRDLHTLFPHPHSLTYSSLKVTNICFSFIDHKKLVSKSILFSSLRVKYSRLLLFLRWDGRTFFSFMFALYLIISVLFPFRGKNESQKFRLSFLAFDISDMWFFKKDNLYVILSVTCTRVNKLVCWSVGRLVGPSIGRSF